MRVTIRNNLLQTPFSTDIPNTFGTMIRVLVPIGETATVLNVDPFFLNQNQLLRELNAVGTLTVTFISDPNDLIVIGAGSDDLVRVTVADTTSGRLDTKITAGSNISLATLNPGANESLEISATDTNTDEFVRVTAADTTPGRLNTKLTAGANIGLATLSPGANESVEITSTPKPSTFNLESPGAAEDGPTDYTAVARTITTLRAVLVGSAVPSVTWTLRFGSDRNAAGTEVVVGGTTTTSITTGDTITVFSNAVIPADNFFWFETTAQSGTVDEVTVSVVFA